MVRVWDLELLQQDSSSSSAPALPCRAGAAAAEDSGSEGGAAGRPVVPLTRHYSYQENMQVQSVACTYLSYQENMQVEAIACTYLQYLPTVNLPTINVNCQLSPSIPSTPITLLRSQLPLASAQ